ncbi:MAG: caspase family protein, partial [Fibrobacteria bacterium]
MKTKLAILLMAMGLRSFWPLNSWGSAPKAGTETSEVRRFSLASGSSFGGPQRDTLLYTAVDALAFGKVLGEMGGVANADTKVLANPTPSHLDAALRDLRAKVASATGSTGRPGRTGRTEVVVYYSGHADERGLVLGEKNYDYDRFRRQMDSIPAHVRIAVLDACASGAITRLKGGKRRPAFTVDASSDMRGYAFLTSSSPEEASQESDQIGSSFFTHYLVSGLRGAADVSGDGKVTLGEAYQFAFHETLARTERTKGGPQHPAYDMKLSGTGDVVMTDMRETTAGLVF